MKYQEAINEFVKHEGNKTEKINQIVLQEIIKNYITYLKKVRNDEQISRSIR